jgi:hypothetical protein
MLIATTTPMAAIHLNHHFGDTTNTHTTSSTSSKLLLIFFCFFLCTLLKPCFPPCPFQQSTTTSPPPRPPHLLCPFSAHFPPITMKNMTHHHCSLVPTPPFPPCSLPTSTFFHFCDTHDHHCLFPCYAPLPSQFLRTPQGPQL